MWLMQLIRFSLLRPQKNWRVCAPWKTRRIAASRPCWAQRRPQARRRAPRKLICSAKSRLSARDQLERSPPSMRERRRIRAWSNSFCKGLSKTCCQKTPAMFSAMGLPATFGAPCWRSNWRRRSENSSISASPRLGRAPPAPGRPACRRAKVRGRLGLTPFSQIAKPDRREQRISRRFEKWRGDRGRQQRKFDVRFLPSAIHELRHIIGGSWPGRGERHRQGQRICGYA